MRRKLIGIHPGIRNIRRALFAYAQEGCNVLILGEPGTGKSLIAECIHSLGQRKASPLRSLNFALLNEHDQRVLLFGTEPPEATCQRQGCLEVPANIVLRNIHKAFPHIQRRIAETASKHSFTRSTGGGKHTLCARLLITTLLSEFRAPSSKELTPELRTYLQGLPKLVIPPLTERAEDIPLLAAYFRKTCLKLPKPALPPDDEILSERFLADYPWTENVRELKACLRSVVTFSHAEILRRKERLEFEKMVMQVEEGEDVAMPESLSAIECELVKIALLTTKRTQAEVAQLLGMSEGNLRRIRGKGGSGARNRGGRT